MIPGPARSHDLIIRSIVLRALEFIGMRTAHWNFRSFSVECLWRHRISTFLIRAFVFSAPPTLENSCNSSNRVMKYLEQGRFVLTDESVLFFFFPRLRFLAVWLGIGPLKPRMPAFRQAGASLGAGEWWRRWYWFSTTVVGVGSRGRLLGVAGYPVPCGAAGGSVARRPG